MIDIMNLFGRLLLLLMLCSIRLGASKTREGKITGGHEAQPHSNPYVVSLQTRFLWMRFRLCAGSILSERWILSAGHCATDSWTEWFAMDAIVGAHNLAKIRSSMIYPISQRIAHPMYRGYIVKRHLVLLVGTEVIRLTTTFHLSLRDTYIVKQCDSQVFIGIDIENSPTLHVLSGVGPYDIAMMKTSRKIRFSNKVQPIRLPFSAPTFEKTDDLRITGWGNLQSNTSKIPNKLQEVNVTYLSYIECYEAVDLMKENFDLNPLKRIHNICSGPITGGIAGCTGDSGGPLVQYIAVASSQTTTAGTTHEEETTTAMASTTPGNTASSTLITTDRPTTTTTRSTTTARSTASPILMATERPPSTTESNTTAASTISPIPMSTDTFTTTGSTTTAGSTISPIPTTTKRSLATAAITTEPTTSSSTTAETTTASTTTAAAITIESETTSVSRRNRSTNIVDYLKNRSIDNLRGLRVDMMPTVIGVLSWGVVPCGDLGAPTVYSNVTNYMDFINKYLHIR